MLHIASLVNRSHLMPSDESFHSPASFNVISIAGIHFAFISC